MLRLSTFPKKRLTSPGNRFPPLGPTALGSWFSHVQILAVPAKPAWASVEPTGANCGGLKLAFRRGQKHDFQGVKAVLWSVMSDKEDEDARGGDLGDWRPCSRALGRPWKKETPGVAGRDRAGAVARALQAVPIVWHTAAEQAARGEASSRGSAAQNESEPSDEAVGTANAARAAQRRAGGKRGGVRCRRRECCAPFALAKCDGEGGAEQGRADLSGSEAAHRLRTRAR